MESQLGLIKESINHRYSTWVWEALDELPDSFTITDPLISGHPIVFASRGFLKMSGYSMEEVIGTNGRMFQGPRTNRRSVMEIREAIRHEREIQINLLNYRKDGTPFWMLFHMRPVFGKEEGGVIHFVAVQVPISRKQRRSRSGFGNIENGLCEDGCNMREIAFGSCRREICSDSVVELDRVLALETNTRGSDVDGPCEASDLEKQKAATAINDILFVLKHHSQMTGRLVSGERCSSSGKGLLNSSTILSLGRIKQSFVLTDPHLPDMPIVYASDAFLKLTGYSKHEVLGQNCRFLSGVGTEPSALYQLKESIQAEQACTVRILNYRKDSSSFWNLLHISPIRNATGKIAYFVGVQIEEGSANEDGRGLSPERRQLSVVGAVKVAIRSLSIGACSSNS
uniref:Putative LOV domain-containing protein n=1 Tax=Aphanopetalum resinosum TaxID=131160 RepID=A0A126X202_9MAGN|nr:putative LOV domain-containing protein [Aphanopetalum resinosum]